MTNWIMARAFFDVALLLTYIIRHTWVTATLQHSSANLYRNKGRTRAFVNAHRRAMREARYWAALHSTGESCECLHWSASLHCCLQELSSAQQCCWTCRLTMIRVQWHRLRQQERETDRCRYKWGCAYVSQEHRLRQQGRETDQCRYKWGCAYVSQE